MAVLSVQQVPITGLAAVTFTAADVAGDEVPANRGVLLLVRNDDTLAKTITVATPGTVRGLAIEDPQVSIAAGTIGAISVVRSVFGATAQITYSAVTSVTVAAVVVDM
ncbi:hypothetical protein FHU38_000967 [Saccharomonospora amisosensis]|uniref:Uncharacterized protein n=1 Tax=Saccharomonospora amisosensis TaxID=1128677 RepID=A0A7X5UM92_9PSEU|nr:hypothetical protein [Saccharomonospora amisosensis]NIJ10623.1 hypothetical protein [Saccharomonospora amisosensis]